MNFTELVRGFVVENFLFGDDSRFSDEASFLENGIIDSTGVLELIEYLERTFNIKVEDEEVIPENLDSLKNIFKYLESKQAGNGASLCAQ
jgi:acyl carrier protein